MPGRQSSWSALSKARWLMQVRDVMMANPVSLAAQSTVLDAAMLMKQADIGDVIVVEKDERPEGRKAAKGRNKGPNGSRGTIAGILTDRDIVVRVIAQGRSPATTRV